MKYDVVIVGAGPAGLRCAEILSKSKLSVLLIDENKELGNKVCAGGIRKNVVDLLDIPKELLEKSFDNIIFNTPFNKINLSFKEKFAFTINRKKLAEYQLSKLNSKIDVTLNTRVIKVTTDEIITNKNEKINYSFLVGADGSNSLVRKYLKLNTEKQNIAIHYLIDGEKKDLEIYYNSKLFNSWYAWIFPHKNYFSVGCGFNPKKYSSEKLISSFNKWMKRKQIDYSLGKYEAYTLNYDYRGYCFQNIFLIGDAGGFSSGLTGEGIYQALVSGEEIAKTIIDPSYVPKKLKRILKIKNLEEKVLFSLMHSYFLRPVLLESIALLFKIKKITNKIINIELKY